jgi:hypothetical protein
LPDIRHIEHGLSVSDERALATIVDEVIDGFGPEARLGGIVPRADVERRSRLGNHRQVMAALIGALLATLPLVEHAVRPRR